MENHRIRVHYRGNGCRHALCRLQLSGRGFSYWLLPALCSSTDLCISALGSDPARVTSVSGPHRAFTRQLVTMTCNIDAIPDVTVAWYKDGILVHSGTSISTIPDESTQLTISSVIPADSGMYQCIVSNEHGDDVGTISLQVRDHGKGP